MWMNDYYKHNLMDRYRNPTSVRKKKKEKRKKKKEKRKKKKEKRKKKKEKEIDKYFLYSIYSNSI
jgi:hypothetical protein